YELQDVVYNIQELSDYSIEDYLQIIRTEFNEKPDLAIIEIPEDFKKLPDSENPYYKIKAKLLSLEIPAQFILSYKLNKYDQNLLNSVALQIYAKLGGTPWVLPAQGSVDREIVIGI